MLFRSREEKRREDREEKIEKRRSRRMLLFMFVFLFEKKGTKERSFAREEFLHLLVDLLGGVLLDPVTGLGNVKGGEIGDVFVGANGEFLAERGVLFSPDHQSGDLEHRTTHVLFLLENGLKRKDVAIIVDHRGDRSL